MSGGCNSCKYLNPDSKKPGRTAGYLFQCNMTGKWVNAAKDSCSYYELEEGRSSYEVNSIYKDSYDYNDMKNDAGCNSCMSLDPKNKKPGKSSGAMYFCSTKGTYIDATSDACEKYSNGYRSSSENNEIYNESKNYSDTSPRDTSFAGILLGILIFIIIVVISFVIK